MDVGGEAGGERESGTVLVGNGRDVDEKLLADSTDTKER